MDTSTIKNGSKILFSGEDLPMTVIAHNIRYIIAHRPLSYKHDRSLVKEAGYAWHDAKSRGLVCYSIADLQERRRGPDNFGGAYLYKTRENAEQVLAFLMDGTVEISRRHSVPLLIIKIY